MAWDKTQWAPAAGQADGREAGHVPAWERHERDGPWWAWVFWVHQADGRRITRCPGACPAASAHQRRPELTGQCPLGCMAAFASLPPHGGGAGWVHSTVRVIATGGIARLAGRPDRDRRRAGRRCGGRARRPRPGGTQNARHHRLNQPHLAGAALANPLRGPATQITQPMPSATPCPLGYKRDR
jgi:hypothetical protein